MAQQSRSWDFDQEEGLLDAARLARVVVNPTQSLSYKIERATEFRDTVVTLLIDNSASMRGRPIGTAAQIRRASWRDIVCQYVDISVSAVHLKNNKITYT